MTTKNKLKMTQKIYQKISFFFAALLIVYIPFQSLLLELSGSHFGLSARAPFWTAHWYEPFILIFFLSSLSVLIKSKEKWQSWQKITLLLLIFGLVSAFLISTNYHRGLEGYRLTLFFLLTLFYLWRSDADEYRKLVSIYLITAAVIALWGIIERFLPAGYWHQYFNFSANFGYGNYLVGTFPRSNSFLGGPNQLGSYLLPAVFLLGSQLTYGNDRLPRLGSTQWLAMTTQKIAVKLKYLVFAILILAIGFAYSRAALLGLIFGLIIFIILCVKNWPDRIKIILISAIAIAIPIMMANQSGNSANTFLTHGDSQSGHVDALNSTRVEIKNRLHQPVKLIFGAGLGTAGPLILKYQDGLIPESWYLQLLLEVGAVGLAIWLILMTILLTKLIKADPPLFLGLMSVSVAALFLHTFADNPAVSYSLFLLIGTKLSGHKLVEAK